MTALNNWPYAVRERSPIYSPNFFESWFVFQFWQKVQGIQCQLFVFLQMLPDRLSVYYAFYFYFRFTASAVIFKLSFSHYSIGWVLDNLYRFIMYLINERDYILPNTQQESLLSRSDHLLHFSNSEPRNVQPREQEVRFPATLCWGFPWFLSPHILFWICSSTGSLTCSNIHSVTRGHRDKETIGTYNPMNYTIFEKNSEANGMYAIMH